MWRLTEIFKSRLEAVEMDVPRRSSRTSRREHVPNEVMKREMGADDNITKDIERKQLVSYGHEKRTADYRLPKEVLLWQPNISRKRGRPKLEWNVSFHKSISEINLTPEDTENRHQWSLGVGQRRRMF
ncbi:hypothetical protein HHI36_022390 [Cryptolaemus montrouzieri]|uniref:Uncharacterized protein n=1 Tax=Cryptolaemus montrouzieri TaxID=559131 RepID=A0ABD2MZN7_9CUCU